MHLLFLQRIYVLLSIIVIALLTTQRDANGDDAESFSACSRVAEAVNQKIHKSGGFLSTYNKFMNTYCDIKGGQLTFIYQIETELLSISSEEKKEIKDEFCSEEKRVFFEFVDKLVSNYFSKQGNLVEQITVTKNSCVK